MQNTDVDPEKTRTLVRCQAALTLCLEVLVVFVVPDSACRRCIVLNVGSSSFQTSLILDFCS